MAVNYIHYPKYEQTLLIDDEDLDLVINKKNGNWIGCYTRSGWALGKGILLHRLIMERVLGRNLRKDELVDHNNRNNCDNTRANLRVSDLSQNARNRTARGTSKYLGVNWNKRDSKRRADIHINGKTIYLGLFDDELKAALAYNRACQLYYPGCEFSALNDLRFGYSNNNLPIPQIKYETRKITKEEYEAKIYEKANDALEAEPPGDYIQLTIPGIERWL